MRDWERAFWLADQVAQDAELAEQREELEELKRQYQDSIDEVESLRGDLEDEIDARRGFRHSSHLNQQLNGEETSSDILEFEHQVQQSNSSPPKTSWWSRLESDTQTKMIAWGGTVLVFVLLFSWAFSGSSTTTTPAEIPRSDIEFRIQAPPDVCWIFGEADVISPTYAEYESGVLSTRTKSCGDYTWDTNITGYNPEGSYIGWILENRNCSNNALIRFFVIFRENVIRSGSLLRSDDCKQSVIVDLNQFGYEG